MIRLPDHVVHLPARPWEGLDHFPRLYGCARPRTYSPLGLVYGAEVVTHVDDLSDRLAVPEELFDLLQTPPWALISHCLIKSVVHIPVTGNVIEASQMM